MLWPVLFLGNLAIFTSLLTTVLFEVLFLITFISGIWFSFDVIHGLVPHNLGKTAERTVNWYYCPYEEFWSDSGTSRLDIQRSNNLVVCSKRVLVVNVMFISFGSSFAIMGTKAPMTWARITSMLSSFLKSTSEDLECHCEASLHAWYLQKCPSRL